MPIGDGAPLPISCAGIEEKKLTSYSNSHVYYKKLM